MAIGAQMPPEEAMLTASQECISDEGRKEVDGGVRH